MSLWLERAQAFLEEKFEDVRLRKDPIFHASEVFRILKEEFGIADTEILTAGILHDVLEDTRTTEEEIRTGFSARTAALVKAVSHERDDVYDRDGYYERLKLIPVEAKWIKLADFVANLEWMLDRLQSGNPVFRNHEPYVRHIRMFLGSSPDPSLSSGEEKVLRLCHRIERLERQFIRQEEFV